MADAGNGDLGCVAGCYLGSATCYCISWLCVEWQMQKIVANNICLLCTMGRSRSRGACVKVCRWLIMQSKIRRNMQPRLSADRQPVARDFLPATAHRPPLSVTHHTPVATMYDHDALQSRFITRIDCLCLWSPPRGRSLVHVVAAYKLLGTSPALLLLRASQYALSHLAPGPRSSASTFLRPPHLPSSYTGQYIERR